MTVGSPLGPLWTRRLGGPLGRHAGPMRWGPPLAWLLGAATFSWVILMFRQVSCVQTDVAKAVNTYQRMCYSDIPILWQTKGFAQGQVPFFSAPFEYPVLTGAFVELSRGFTQLTGAPHAVVTPAEMLQVANHAFVVTAVLAYAMFLVLVYAHHRMTPALRVWDTLMIALSPSVMATGLINWDALVIALTALALLLWARVRPGWAGVFLGLAVAAKFYPLFLLGAFLLLCLRAARLEDFARLVLGGSLSWLAVNLPVMFWAPGGWNYFWSFNATRGADLGSGWYALRLAGLDMSGAATWSKVLLVVGFAGIAMLTILAPRRPRLGQVAFLIVAWFLMTNTVYSPQYVLWLLPLLVLARPVWSNWAVFTLAEFTYFMAVWMYLDNADSTTVLYIIAIFLRISVQVWFCLLVIYDMMRPDEDPLRLDGNDDPIGGLLVGAPDAAWVERWRRPLPEVDAASVPVPGP